MKASFLCMDIPTTVSHTVFSCFWHDRHSDEYLHRPRSVDYDELNLTFRTLTAFFCVHRWQSTSVQASNLGKMLNNGPSESQKLD
jgi:hypothetical protein